MNSIVIGSGFGGLAAALRLKAKGHKLTLDEKISLRITKNLVRLSVGLEDSTDIIKDIDNALKKAKKK